MNQSLFGNFVAFFTVSGVTLAFVAAIVLLSNRRKTFVGRMLGGFFLVHGWSLFIGVLYVSGFLLVAPFLYRTGSPFHYIMPVFAYLYVRSALLEESGWRRYDWLMFVPAALHFIEYLPFYLQSFGDKLDYIKFDYAHPSNLSRYSEGILPDYWHPFLKLIFMFFYSVLMWRLYWQWKNGLIETGTVATTSFRRWIVFFINANSLFYLTLFFPYMNMLPFDSRNIVVLVVSLFVLISSGALFFYPSILYGNHISAAPHEDESDFQERTTFTLRPEQRAAYKSQIQSFMETEQPYRRRGYSIRNMSEQLNIPQHHLSIVLNQDYKVNFNDFINRWRIEHVCQVFEFSDWQSYTMEGVASDAGFNSRTTFYLAFKKLTGVSPSEYLRDKKLELTSA